MNAKMASQATGLTRHLIRIVLSFVLLLSTMDQVTPVAEAATLPPGFVDSFVATVDKPTALAFTPDGRLLAASQPGKLFVVQQNGAKNEALDLSSSICSNVERGLMGIAVDPSFASNHYIYLYYTFKKYPSAPDPCPLYDPAMYLPVNRVSRFTLPDNNVISLASQLILLDNIPQLGGYHNAGDLQFGKLDNLLYISVGDGSNAPYGQRKDRLAGKILRIEPDGDIPPGNPFVGESGSGRCGNPAGGSDTGTCQEIFAYGLRNPYRIAFRPGTNQFYINDVGQDTWEEISASQAGANYGWPCREGKHDFRTTANYGCDPFPSTIDPIFEYQHGAQIPGTTSPTNCLAVTGGAFVPGGLWPGYNGAYIFADYVCDGLFRLTQSGNTYTASDFASGVDGPTHILFGPYNNTQALYYTSRNGKQVRRIVYSTTPSAVISANPTYGLLNLDVTFSAVGSTDPGGQSLVYDWNFGDGASFIGGVSQTVNHIYTVGGIYTATLVARNANGTSAPASIQIQADNTPPVPVITAPASNAQFEVGQVVSLSGNVTDAQDAANTVKLNWDVLLHHVDELNPEGDHTHPWYSTAPVTTPAGTLTGSTTFPAAEGLRATKFSYVEIQLTATDAWGLTTVVTRSIQPKEINLTFKTQPSNLSLQVADLTLNSTQTIVSWQNYGISVTAPSPQQDGGGQWRGFSSWSDGGAATHTIFTPVSSITYTATFAIAYPLWLPIVAK